MKPFKFLSGQQSFGIPNFPQILSEVVLIDRIEEIFEHIDCMVFQTNYGKFIILSASDPQSGKYYYINNGQTQIDDDAIFDVDYLRTRILFEPIVGGNVIFRLRQFRESWVLDTASDPTPTTFEISDFIQTFNLSEI